MPQSFVFVDVLSPQVNVLVLSIGVEVVSLVLIRDHITGPSISAILDLLKLFHESFEKVIAPSGPVPDLVHLSD